MTQMKMNLLLHMLNKAKKILNMVDKAKNIGTTPIDGDDPEVYSYKIPWNEFSIMKPNEKFDKTRPPPTYIDFWEYEEQTKKWAFWPLTGLKALEDIDRIEWIDDKVIKDMKGLKTYLMKQLAKNIFRGNASVSLPAYAFNPVSNVSAFMNNFRTAPHYLNKAVHISPITEPEERIKLITAMWVSSLHQNISFKRFFNPILGETYEGYFCYENSEIVSEDDELIKKFSTSQLQRFRSTSIKQKSQPYNLKSKFIQIYVEQISHHPPVSSFLIEHPDRDYTISGHFEEKFTRHGSNLEFRILGETVIEFSDGDKYSISWPTKILENNVHMKYEEFIRVEQIGEELLTSMVFLGDACEGEPFPIDGLIYYRNQSVVFNPKSTSQSDLNDVEELWCSIYGSWIKSLIIDDKKYWSIKNNVITPHLPVSNPLPSDWRYREDLVWVWRDDYNIAQKWKLALENIQRKDAALRKKKKK